MLREMKSALATNSAPKTAEAGNRNVLRGPRKNRRAWGTTSPTKAIMPTTVTPGATNSTTATSANCVTRSASTPRARAAIDPRDSGSTRLAIPKAMTSPTITKGAIAMTPDQVANAKDPFAQKEKDRPASLLTKGVASNTSAREKKLMATPPSSRAVEFTFPSRLAIARTTISPTPAIITPTNASGIELKGMPSAAPILAPAAPEAETPTMEGAARGFPKTPCSRPPATARPAPTTRVSTTLGARILHTICGLTSAKPVTKDAAKTTLTAMTPIIMMSAKRPPEDTFTLSQRNRRSHGARRLKTACGLRKKAVPDHLLQSHAPGLQHPFGQHPAT